MNHPDRDVGTGAGEAEVLRKARGITSRFFEGKTNRNIQNALAEFGVDSRFILSFPRSGNGFLRHLLAKVVLHREGYPVFDAKRRAVSGLDRRRVQAIVFGNPRIAPIIFDEIFPDGHRYRPEEIAKFDSRFLVADARWIKTHSEVSAGLGDFVFLFRDPVVACSSFFNLVATPEIVDRVIEGELSALYHGCIEIFLDAYERMARSALDGWTRGDCHPVSLKRLETGDFEQIADWLRAIGEPFDHDALGKIVEATPKFSRFDHRLLALWDDKLRDRAAAAIASYQELESARARPSDKRTGGLPS
jgi:hypothetical protein